MQKGKIIVIEGTDCSGKETQSKKLAEALTNNGFKTVRMQFPMYDTPTGQIVGGPYLGKDYICEGFFPEGAAHVDPKVASLYYAADRKYNMPKIMEQINNGVNVILDRYVYSNMGHQAGKIKDEVEQNEMIAWLEKLEFDFLELPRPDMTIFLFMPYEATLELRKGREETADQHEADPEHIICAQNTYLKLAKKFLYEQIDCVENGRIKTPDEIADEVYKKVINTYYFDMEETNE